MDEQVAVLAVAERGSLDAAGRCLGIGKSGVRKRLLGVESELGTPVFRAVGSGMVPTDAGSLYLSSARESVRQALLGVDRVRAFVKAQSKDFRIGYSSYLNTRLLEIVRRIQPVGSRTVTRESLMTHQAIIGVLQGYLHVGFGVLPILEPDISSRLLLEEPLMACLPVGHRLAAKATIQPEDLESEPIVALSHNVLPGRHEEITRHFESLGVFLKYVAEVCSVKEALWLVTQGAGVSLMTRFSAMSCRYDVIVRPLSDRLLTVKSGVFIRRDVEDAFVRDFVDLAWSETAVVRANEHWPRKRGRHGTSSEE